MNQLYKLIKDRFPLLNLTAVQRRHFNDAAGRHNIQTLCAPQYSAVYLQVLHKYVVRISLIYKRKKRIKKKKQRLIIILFVDSMH